MNVSCPVCGHSGNKASVRLGGFRIVECLGCTHHYAADAMEQAVDYDAIYETLEYYEAQVREIENEQVLHSYRVHGTYRYFFEQNSVVINATLLDIGCGVGRFLHAAHQAGFSVSGIDISALAIRIGSNHASFSMRSMTLQELAASGERYDCITSFEVLEHLSKPLEFLIAMKSILTANGSVFVTVPNWNCKMVQQALRNDWIPPVHRNFFTKTSLAELGKRACFSSVVCGKILSDPLPQELSGRMWWMVRRMAGRKVMAPGLWMKGLA
jgi:SAM-dependent methyltransferase